MRDHCGARDFAARTGRGNPELLWVVLADSQRSGGRGSNVGNPEGLQPLGQSGVSVAPIYFERLQSDRAAMLEYGAVPACLQAPRHVLRPLALKTKRRRGPIVDAFQRRQIGTARNL